MEELRDKDGLTEKEFLAQYRSDIYPKPSATADICVFARTGVEAELLLIRRGGHPCLGRWALPGGFANKNEPLEKTAARELKEETGITGVTLRLVGVYSEPGRDPRGWTISAAYAALTEKSAVTVKAGDDAREVAWFKVIREDGEIFLRHGGISLSVSDGCQPASEELAFDHKKIIGDAIRQILSPAM